MKKVSLVAGLGLLATVGVVFASWSFATSGTSFSERADGVAVGIDDQVTHTGNHGTLVLSKATIPTLTISQNSAKDSAAWYKTVETNLVGYTGEDEAITLKYTPALDDDEPAVYSYTVSWTVEISAKMVEAGMSVTNDHSNLYVAQSRLTSSITMADVLGCISFPSITNSNQAKSFIDKLNAGDLGITVKFALVANPADATLGSDQSGYRLNGGAKIGMTWHADKSDNGNYKEYLLANINLVEGDVFQFYYGDSNSFAPQLQDDAGVAVTHFERVNLQGVDYVRCKTSGTYDIYYKTLSTAVLYIALK